MLRKPIILCWIINLWIGLSVTRAQCPVPLSPPSSSTTDAIASSGESIGTGTTKWYKSTGTLSSLTINGGTFIVDGNLTINSLTINSGEIYIRPGARLTVMGSIILYSNSKIFNYGTFNIDQHLYMMGPTTSATPNCVVNATPSASISSPFNDVYINAPNSTFINNGKAQFRSIFTTGSSAPGSVVLNEGSETQLQSIFNQKENAWDVPGSACVSVSSSSWITKKVTNSPNLKIALGSSHTCNSCTTSPYGGAQVFNGAPSCASIITLPIQLSNFSIKQNKTCNVLSWKVSSVLEHYSFIVERSSNGINFQELSRVQNNSTMQYQLQDCLPNHGVNYYRLKFLNSRSNEIGYSGILSVKNEDIQKISIHPNPIVDQFTVRYNGEINGISKMILRNSLGQTIPITVIHQNKTLIIQTPKNLISGVYFLQFLTEVGTYNYRLIK